MMIETPSPVEPERNYKPWENVKPKLAEKQKTILSEKPPHTTTANFVQIHGDASLQNLPSRGVPGCELNNSSLNALHLPQIEERVSTAERTKLENMSRDIITGK